MKMMITIFLLALGSNSFAAHDQKNDYLVVAADGYGFQCRGFCSGHQEDSELVAKRHTELVASKKCQNEGYENIVLIGEFSCKSHTVSFGNFETTTKCSARYLCE